jgi:hypothetical protein
MTPIERSKPSVIDVKRKKNRIARVLNQNRASKSADETV